MTPPLNKTMLNNMAAQLQGNLEHQTLIPDPLQSTDGFLDHANRDVRRHFCILTDVEGKTFFLRPDFTLPICLYYARSADQPAQARRFFYEGEVWLWDIQEAVRREQYQMGVEHIGVEDQAAAAAFILAATQAALAEASMTQPVLRMGDPGLFDLVLAALDLPEDWQSRLKRLFRRNAGPVQLNKFFEQAQATMRARVENTAEANFTSIKELDLFLKNNNITHIGQRRREEIVERLREQNALHAPDLPEQVMNVIRAFLNLPPDHPERTLENIRAFSQENGLGLDDEISEIALRFDAMKKTAINDIFAANNALFATYFQGAYLNYYTGFVFAFLPSRQDALRSNTDYPLAGGGHYNGLMRTLGIENGTGVGVTIYLNELARHV